MLKDIELVPITIDDYQFGYEIKKITLKEYTEKTWGDWDEEEQIIFYKKEFKIDNCYIIKYNNINIGWLKIIETIKTIDINQILILPEHQRKGIGSTIINYIIKNGRDKNKTICLQVLKCNENAKRLYIKLGFKKYDETKTHFLLNIK